MSSLRHYQHPPREGTHLLPRMNLGGHVVIIQSAHFTRGLPPAGVRSVDRGARTGTHAHHYGVPNSPPCSDFISCPSNPWQPLVFAVSAMFPLPKCHRIGVLRYTALPDVLLALGNVRLRFFRIFSWPDSSFPFSTEDYSTVWMDHGFTCPFTTQGHLALVTSEIWQ